MKGPEILPPGWTLTEAQPERINGSETLITNGKVTVLWVQTHAEQVFSIDGKEIGILPQAFGGKEVRHILAPYPVAPLGLRTERSPTEG